MTGDITAFEEILGALDYPMFVVTAASGDDVDGCLVGFATQCSITPARFLVCLSKQNRTTQLASTATSLAVHVLRDTDLALAERFGSLTGDEADKLRDLAWTQGPDGTAILDGLDWFAGRILARHDAGDHIAHVLDIDDGATSRSETPALGYQAVRDLEPGHAP